MGYMGWRINFVLGQNLDILKHLTQVSTVKASRAGISKTNMNNMLMQLRKYVVQIAIDYPSSRVVSGAFSTHT
jgi:hypothetical protein